MQTNLKILVIDIETTGFVGQGGAIVEIGIVELDLATGEIKVILDTLLKEDILTEEHQSDPYGWIFTHSDLKFEDLEDAPPGNEVLQKVQEILDQYPNGATAFNKAFDFGFFKNRGLRVKELPCPMLLSTDVCRLKKKNGYGGWKWPKVEEAYQFFYPEDVYDELHRGADDAAHEAKIVYALYKLGIFKI